MDRLNRQRAEPVGAGGGPNLMIKVGLQIGTQPPLALLRASVLAARTMRLE